MQAAVVVGISIVFFIASAVYYFHHPIRVHPTSYLFKDRNMEWDISVIFKTKDIFAVGNQIDVIAFATVNDTRLHENAQLYFLGSEPVPRIVVDTHTIVGKVPLTFADGRYSGNTTILYREPGAKCIAIAEPPPDTTARTPANCPPNFESVITISPLESQLQLDSDRLQNTFVLAGAGGAIVGVYIAYLGIQKKNIPSGSDRPSKNNRRRK